MAASSELLQKLQRRRERNGERSPLLDIGSNNEVTRTTDFEAVKVQQRRIVFEAAISERSDLGSWEHTVFPSRQTQQPLSSSTLTEAYMLPKDSTDVDLENLIPECYHENITSDAHADKGVSELHRKLQRRRKRMGEQFQQRGIDTSLFDSVTKDLEMVKVDERRTMFENAEFRITPPNANPGKLDLSKWEQQLEEGVQPIQQSCLDRHHAANIHHEMFTREVTSKDGDQHQHDSVRAGYSLLGGANVVSSGAAKYLEAVNVDERRSIFESTELRDANANVLAATGRLDLSKWEGAEFRDVYGIAQVGTGRLDLSGWEGNEFQDTNGTVQIGARRLDSMKLDANELQDSNGAARTGTGRPDLNEGIERQDPDGVQSGTGRLDLSRWEATENQDLNGIVQTATGRLDLSRWEGTEIEDSNGTAQVGTGRLDLSRWEGSELQDTNGTVQIGAGRLDSMKLEANELQDSNGAARTGAGRLDLNEGIEHQDPDGVQSGTGRLDLSRWEATDVQDSNGIVQTETGRLDLSRWEGTEIEDSNGSVPTGAGRLDLTRWEAELVDDKPPLQHDPYRQQRVCMSEETSAREGAPKVDMSGCFAKESSDIQSSMRLVSDDSKGLDSFHVGSDFPRDPHEKREQLPVDSSEDDLIVSSRDSQIKGFESVDSVGCRSPFTKVDLQGPHISAIPCSSDLSPWEEGLIARGVMTYQQACLLRKHAPNSYNAPGLNQDISLKPSSSGGMDSLVMDGKGCTQNCEQDQLSQNAEPACETYVNSADLSQPCEACSDLPQESQHRHNRKEVDAVSKDGRTNDFEGVIDEPCDHLLVEDHNLQKPPFDFDLERLDLSPWELTVDRDALPMREDSPWRAKDTVVLNDNSETTLDEIDSRSSQPGLCCATDSPTVDPLSSNITNLPHVDSTEKLLLQACDILAKSEFTSKSDSDSGSPEASITSDAEEIQEHNEYDVQASIEKPFDKIGTGSEVDVGTIPEDRKAQKSMCRISPTMLDMSKIEQPADTEDVSLSQVRCREYEEHQSANHEQENNPRREDCKLHLGSQCSERIAPSESALSKTSSAREVRQEVQSKFTSASSTSSSNAPPPLVPTLAPTKRINAVMAVPVAASSTAACISSNYIVAQGRTDSCASMETIDPTGLVGMSRIHSIGDISLGSRGNSEAFGRIRHWPGRRLGPSTPCTPRSRSCSTTTSPNKQVRQARVSKGAVP